MNSEFQKPSTNPSGGRSSATDPPYAPGASPGQSSSPAGGGNPTSGYGREGGRKAAGRSASGAASGSSPSGSEALLDETQDAVGAATDSLYTASGAVRDAGAQISDVAKEALRATASAMSAQAAELTSNITSELTETAEAQKERGAEAMHRFAKAIRTAARELDDGSPEVARQIRAAAGSVDSLSDNLHGKSVGDLFSAATDFARSQPAAFFAGAVIAGFAVSRFLRSSSQPTPQSNGRREPMTAPGSTTAQGVAPSAPSAATF